jgi:hypothetical protein
MFTIPVAHAGPGWYSASEGNGNAAPAQQDVLCFASVGVGDEQQAWGSAARVMSEFGVRNMQPRVRDLSAGACRKENANAANRIHFRQAFLRSGGEFCGFEDTESVCQNVAGLRRLPPRHTASLSCKPANLLCRFRICCHAASTAWPTCACLKFLWSSGCLHALHASWTCRRQILSKSGSYNHSGAVCMHGCQKHIHHPCVFYWRVWRVFALTDVGNAAEVGPFHRAENLLDEVRIKRRTLRIDPPQQAPTPTHTCTHARTHARTHTRTRARAHTHTHKHTTNISLQQEETGSKS